MPPSEFRQDGPTTSFSLCLFFLAFFIRLLYAHFSGTLYLPPTGFDEVFFDGPARTFVTSGHLSPSGEFPIGQVLLLIAIYSVFGVSTVIARLSSIILSSATVVLVYHLAFAWCKETCALLTGMLCAIHPWLFFRATSVQTEVSSLFLFCLVLHFVFSFIKANGTIQLLLCGGFFGLCLLVRPDNLLKIAIIFTLLIVTTKSLRRSTSRTGLILAIALLLFSPWCVYVSNKAGYLAFGGLRLGHTLYGANCDAVYDDPVFRGMWSSFPDRNLEAPEFKSLPIGIRDRVMRERGIAWIRNNPGRFVELGFYKLGRLFSLYRPFQGSRFHTKLAVVQFWGVLALAIWGLVVCIRARRFDVLPLVIWIAVTCLQCVVFHGANRFRHQCEPAILIFAAIGICSLLRDTSSVLPSAGSTSDTPLSRSIYDEGSVH